MKKNYTKFDCDECKAEIEIVKDEGYPYYEGWCYIYNFTAKFLKSYDPEINIDIEITRTEQKDKHFCSEKCMIAFIKKAIRECKKPKNTEVK